MGCSIVNTDRGQVGLPGKEKLLEIAGANIHDDEHSNIHTPGRVARLHRLEM
jgi:hypothetical protein